MPAIRLRSGDGAMLFTKPVDLVESGNWTVLNMSTRLLQQVHKVLELRQRLRLGIFEQQVAG
ncbi:MAG: hypothetical protein ACYCUY_01980 [Acidithiobacillus sp.]